MKLLPTSLYKLFFLLLLLSNNDSTFSLFFFFFNDTATTEIYTLSLHDALPICWRAVSRPRPLQGRQRQSRTRRRRPPDRSEEHTSELQSPCNLVCRLLLEKKKKKSYAHIVWWSYMCALHSIRVDVPSRAYYRYS